MNIAMIGLPMDLGAGRRGVDMGPSAIRCAGLAQQLRAIGHEVQDLGNVELSGPEVQDVGDPTLKYFAPIRASADELASRLATLSPDVVSTVPGGDHSISLGSVTGTAQRYGEIGVLWVDAHGDFNTTKTTPSGNIHGMVLAALAGKGNERLTSIGGFSPKVAFDHISILGARLLDAGERDLLHEYGVHVFTMHDVDRRGLPAVAQEAIAAAAAGGVPLHVSFDIDVVDPRDAPGVGTPVPGGMTFRDAHLIMELIAETGTMRSLDLVEVNPI